MRSGQSFEIPPEVNKNYYVKFKEFLRERFSISIPEWHSIVFGGAIGIVGGTATFLPVIAYIITNEGLKKHLKDVKNEIVYALVSFSVVEIIQSYGVGVI